MFIAIRLDFLKVPGHGKRYFHKRDIINFISQSHYFEKIYILRYFKNKKQKIKINLFFLTSFPALKKN